MQKITFTLHFWKRFTFVIILMIGLFSLPGYAQEAITVKGVVIGLDDGTTLPGASVAIKNTTKGTVTNVSGRYSINAPIGSVLVFSYVGYQPLEETVTGPTLNASLLTKLNSLNEVVVIGYGTVRKKDLIGAVANIRGSAIKAQGKSDITSSLQGKLAGVTIESAGGNPGSGTRILIRGVGTLGNSAPLYIVDGVPVANINNLSSVDIQSIDVLRDASAAAIYGTRAANGVVLVTTKSGKDGQPVVQMNANYGIQNLAHKVDVLNASQ